MVEVAEEMKKALNVSSMEEFYQLFSSFIEALHVMIPVTVEKDDSTALRILRHLEKDITKIYEELTSERLHSIKTIIQFSLGPNCRKLKNHFQNGDKCEEYIIGIYDPKTNPVFSYNKERLTALLKEAKKQEVKIYMFESKDVDIKEGKIHARFSLDSEEKETIQIPDAIYNVWPNLDYNHDSIERWLRERIPFSSFPINDKIILPKKMLERTHLGHLFIPFIGVLNIQRVLRFLAKNKRGVLKKSAVARGENIFFIEQRSTNRFTVEVDKKPIIMNKEGFANWIEEYIIPERYILQEYKEFRTKQQEPFDIRSHVQKNGEGKWTITKIYPRIGSEKTILSNISLGGRILDLMEFLKEEYSNDKATRIFNDLNDLSIEVASAIDKIYNYSIDELGLDFAIDKNERIWMHEANAKPQTKYHEEERAVNTIAYLKYLAKNRLFLTNDMQESSGFDNQFIYQKNSDLEIKDLDSSKVTIGLLYDQGSTKEEFIEACAIVSKYIGVNFYAFQAQDIDYKNKVIKAKKHENFELKEYVVRYPDVVYDRLRMESSSIYNLVYRELEELPFTHTLQIKDMNKLNVYEKLSKIGSLKNHLIPFGEVQDEEKLIEFLNDHESIILKPILGSFAIGIIKIEKIDNRYYWYEEDKVHEYSLTQVKRICRQREIYGKYLMQKYMEFKSKNNNPTDIRLHMIKDKEDNNKWHVAKSYVRISHAGYKINTEIFSGGRGFSGSTMHLNRYVEQNMENNSEEIVKNILVLAQKIAVEFDQLHDGKIAEQALDLGLTLDGEVFIIEINVNRPGIYGYEFEIAKYMIPYAATLKL